jgi:hypothetical protein
MCSCREDDHDLALSSSSTAPRARGSRRSNRDRILAVPPDGRVCNGDGCAEPGRASEPRSHAIGGAAALDQRVTGAVPARARRWLFPEPRATPLASASMISLSKSAVSSTTRRTKVRRPRRIRDRRKSRHRAVSPGLSARSRTASRRRAAACLARSSAPRFAPKACRTCRAPCSRSSCWG